MEDRAARVPASTGGPVPAGAMSPTDGTAPGSDVATPPPERRLRPPTLRATLLIATGIVFAAILYLARGALAPFVIGLFLVYLLDPLVSWLHRRARMPRWTAILLVYAAIVLVAVLLVRITAPALAQQIGALLGRLPELLTSTIQALERVISDLDLLPVALRAELVASLEAFASDLASRLASLDLGALLGFVDPGAIAGSVASLIGAVLAYAVIPIFVFYILKDRPALSVTARSALPEEWRPDLEAVVQIVDRVFARWVRGQLLLGLVVGAMTFVGLVALGVIVDPVFRDFAVILAVSAGLLELVPIIGPIISAVPAIILGATAGVPGIVAAFLLYLAVQQIENNFLVPKIQGDATDLHPGFVLAAIVIGSTIAGFLGAILALPITAAGRDVVRYLMRRLAPTPMPVDAALAEALKPASWRAVTPASAAAEEVRAPAPIAHDATTVGGIADGRSTPDPDEPGRAAPSDAATNRSSAGAGDRT